jgi:hypothetical protein
MNKTVPSELAVVSGDLRPLEFHERVRRGDFVADGRQGFEPWEGPAGFRADAFVKTIYRRLKASVAGVVKAR